MAFKISMICLRLSFVRLTGPSAQMRIRASSEPSVSLFLSGVHNEFIKEKIRSTQAVVVGMIFARQKSCLCLTLILNWHTDQM